jgi:ABC-type multidrug transport system ATPase subunit/predicted phosphodiesterase
MYKIERTATLIYAAAMSIQRIFHLSDIHLPDGKDDSAKKIDEYKYLFGQIACEFQKLNINRDSDLIVITGDIFNAKTYTTSHSTGLFSIMIKTLSDFAHVVVIPGNHDVNMVDKLPRHDLISPWAAMTDRFTYYARSGVYVHRNLRFGVMSVIDDVGADEVANKVIAAVAGDPSKINVGLAHGGVSFNNGQHGNILTHHFANTFKMVLLGDWHRFQTIPDYSHIAYAGALTQTARDHRRNNGFAVWDVETAQVELKTLRNPWGVLCIEINSDGARTDNQGITDTCNMEPLTWFVIESGTDIKCACMQHGQQCKHTYSVRIECTDATVESVKTRWFDAIVRRYGIRPTICEPVSQSRKLRNTTSAQELKSNIRSDTTIRDIVEKTCNEVAPDLTNDVMAYHNQHYRVSAKDSSRRVWAVHELRIQNFITFQDAHFVIPEGVVALSGNNGMGKSLTVDALCIGIGRKSCRIGHLNEFGNFTITTTCHTGGYASTRKIVKHHKKDSYSGTPFLNSHDAAVTHLTSIMGQDANSVDKGQVFLQTIRKILDIDTMDLYIKNLLVIKKILDSKYDKGFPVARTAEEIEECEKDMKLLSDVCQALRDRLSNIFSEIGGLESEIRIKESNVNPGDIVPIADDSIQITEQKLSALNITVTDVDVANARGKLMEIQMLNGDALVCDLAMLRNRLQNLMKTRADLQHELCDKIPNDISWTKFASNYARLMQDTFPYTMHSINDARAQLQAIARDEQTQIACEGRLANLRKQLVEAEVIPTFDEFTGTSWSDLVANVNVGLNVPYTLEEITHAITKRALLTVSDLGDSYENIKIKLESLKITQQQLTQKIRENKPHDMEFNDACQCCQRNRVKMPSVPDLNAELQIVNSTICEYECYIDAHALDVIIKHHSSALCKMDVMKRITQTRIDREQTIAKLSREIRTCEESIRTCAVNMAHKAKCEAIVATGGEMVELLRVRDAIDCHNDAEIMELSETIKNAQLSLDKYEQLVVDKAKWESIAAMDSDIKMKRELEKMLISLKNTELSRAVAKLRQRLSVLVTERDALSTSFTLEEKKLRGLEDKLRLYQAQLPMYLEYLEYTKQYRVISTYYDIVSKIPNRMLTEITQTLQTHINNTLKQIAPFSAKLTIDASTVHIILEHANGLRTNALIASGSQKFLISIAMHVAFSELVQKDSLDLLVIDEGFSTFDPEHLAKVPELFAYLRGKFRSIIVISHTEEILSIADFTYVIKHDANGKSIFTYPDDKKHRDALEAAKAELATCKPFKDDVMPAAEEYDKVTVQDVAAIKLRSELSAAEIHQGAIPAPSNGPKIPTGNLLSDSAMFLTPSNAGGPRMCNICKSTLVKDDLERHCKKTHTDKLRAYVKKNFKMIFEYK